MNIKKYIPLLDWLPRYKKEYLAGDISAGLTVGVMLIPQGIAYAMVAGLPPVYGLYASMIPQVIYAFFGSSRQLSVGPVAMDSLLVFAGVSALAAVGSENYIALTILLTLMVGIIQLAFGVMRLGFVGNFLSKPVISGFTSAAAIIIGSSQLKYILGVDLGSSASVFETFRLLFAQFHEVNIYTVGVALVGFVLVKYAKKIHKALPGALMAVILGIVLVRVFDLDLAGVAIIGEVPQGLPSFEVPTFSKEALSKLMPVAFTLTLIAFMEAMSIGKALQARHKKEYQIDNNQELIGLGFSNIIGSFFGTFPSAGSFSRSAVNDEAGARTNLSAFLSAAIIALTLLFFTSLFYYLPEAILGVIILVAVFGLVDVKYPQFLWKVNRQDFYMLIGAFLVTLIFGIIEGIIVGVFASILFMIFRSTRPHIAVLGKLPDTKDYRNVDRFKKIEVRKDVLVLRHDAQLYFANIDNFVAFVQDQVNQKGEDLKLFVLHCGSISSIDSTALQLLQELIDELQAKGVNVAFSGLIGPVRDFLHRTKFIEQLGKEHFFIDVQSAIDFFDGKHDVMPKRVFKHALQTNIFKEKEV